MPSVEPQKNNSKIPVIDYTIDFIKLGYGVELREALVPLINKISGWNDVSRECDLELKRASGLTNCVFFITKKPSQPNNEKPLKCVLRVYGHGVDHLIDRSKELDLLKRLSSIKIEPLLLPELLGIFTNGRFEQYLESTTLTWTEMRTESCRIAQLMARLHCLINLLEPPQDITPETFRNLERWFPLAREAGRNTMKEFDFDSLEKDIDELKIMLAKLNSPLVFAHNDMQGGNILRLTDGSDRLAVVDFEYAGYNYRGFDLANHICEWQFNYDSPEPHKINLNDYPNEKQLECFLQAYIEAENHLSSSPSSLSPLSSSSSLTSSSSLLSSSNDNNNLQKLKIEIEAFTLASHAMWGVWALAQSCQSQIDFDYWAYGMERLRIFMDPNRRLDVYKKINLLFQS